MAEVITIGTLSRRTGVPVKARPGCGNGCGGSTSSSGRPPPSLPGSPTSTPTTPALERPGLTLPRGEAPSLASDGR